MKQRFVMSLIVAAILLPVVSMAAVPQTLSYQGYVTDSGGNPVNGTVSVQFSLYQTASGPTMLWTETLSSVTVANGVYSVVLGNSNPLDAAMFGAPLYLGITVGADPEMTPRHALTVAPYAFRAIVADGVSASSNISTQNPIVSTVAAGTAPLSVASTTVVSNLNTDMVDGKHATDFVLKTGDTMTGPLNISAVSGAPVISAVNTGSGQAATVQINNSLSNSHALYVATNGTGSAYGLYSLSTGLSRAGVFEINNGSNGGEAMLARTNGTGQAVHGYTNGTGNAAVFDINNSGNASDALYVLTNGGGRAGYFQINSASNTSPGLEVTTNGTGQAGRFQIANPSSNAHVLYATTNGNGYAMYANTSGTGYALYAQTTGTGVAGSFLINNALSANHAVYAQTTGTGNAVYSLATGQGKAGHFQINNPASNSHALYVTTNGTGAGHGIFSYSTGLGRAGFFEISNASNGGEAVFARTNGSGQALHATTTGTGNAGIFSINNASNSSDALYVTTNGTGRAGYFNGAVQVTGPVSASSFSGDGTNITNTRGISRFTGRANGITAGSATRYALASGASSVTLTESDVTTLLSNSSCTARNLTVKTTSAPGFGNWIIFTIRDDGAGTAVACMIADTSTYCESGPISDTIAPGSELALEMSINDSFSSLPGLSVLFGWECR